MNTIEVIDIENNKHVFDVIKIIKNNEINKEYIVYKDNDDILVSQLIKENNNYQILPVLDNEWDYIENNLK